MPLTTIQYGSLASSEVMNDNFGYLDNRITTVSNNLTSTANSLSSSIAGINTTLTQMNEDLEDDIEQLEADLDSLETDFNNKDDAPDYTQGISITREAMPYTIEKDGYIDVAIAASNGTAVLYINQIKIAHAYSSAPGYDCAISGQYRVCSGDVISYTGYAFQWMKFFPLKGGNDVLQS